MVSRRIQQEWPFEVSGSRLRWRYAQPMSPTTESFNCGSEWWDEEVNGYVRAGRWNRPNQTNYEFGLDGKSVGFAFIEPGPVTSDDSDAEPQYFLTVLVAGLNTDYQGEKEPGTDVRFSRRMFDFLESVPRDVEIDGRIVGRTIGLRLQVREENKGARKFYSRYGFTDVGEPFDDRKGRRTIEMRKPFEPGEAQNEG